MSLLFEFFTGSGEVTVKMTFTASGWTGKRQFYQSKSSKKKLNPGKTGFTGFKHLVITF